MSWTKMSRRILIVLMCGLMLGVSACTEAQKEQAAAAAEQRKRTFAERALKERASEYWNLVRWRTWDNAASYLEDEAEQLEYLRGHTDVGADESPTIQDLEVQYVFVGAGQEEGEIRITWTEVVAAEGRVADQTVTQRWYKHHGKWWVDPNETLGRKEVGQLDESAAPEEPPADIPTETP
ncbi:MAG: hypothetical protein GY898_06580 [Proteobacteria bacterium]|nr:hypothetical protein [Pseudomonadota bacterium]